MARAMIRRYASLFRQDLKVTLRSGFTYVVVILAAILVAVVDFAVPSEVKLTPSELFVDLTEDKAFESVLRRERVEEARILRSREELTREVESTRSGIGIVMEGDLENPRFTVIHQGTEAPENLNLLDATLEGLVRLARGAKGPTASEIESLRPGARAARVPFNKGLVPLVMVFEVVMFGFVVIAVMVFEEKQEGSIRAIRVSPARPLEYILSKASVNVLLALAYGALVVTFTIGPGVDYPRLFLLVGVAAFLMTLVSLSVAVFFGNVSEFLFVAIIFMAIFSIPMASYLMPSFAPAFATWIPSFPVVFGVREILFPTGKEGFLAPMLGTLVAETAVFLAASHWAVTRKLMREGK